MMEIAGMNPRCTLYAAHMPAEGGDRDPHHRRQGDGSPGLEMADTYGAGAVLGNLYVAGNHACFGSMDI